MIGSFEDGEIVIRMSKEDASILTSDLFYTIDYREEEYPEYHALQQALYEGIRKAGVRA